MSNLPAANCSDKSKLVHPGQFVKEEVLLPKKLTVVAAAKLVGVGRPALSNFLNGKVTLTSEMALRIEIAFGIPAQRLLDMQASYDATFNGKKHRNQN